MANIIRIKRGTKVPSIANLSYVGQMAINTSTNKVYIRGTSKVIEITSSTNATSTN